MPITTIYKYWLLEPLDLLELQASIANEQNCLLTLAVGRILKGVLQVTHKIIKL